MRSNHNAKFFLLAAVCCGVFTTTQAQFVSNYKKAADEYYAKGDYNSAAQYYEKYIGAAPSSKEGYDPYTIQKQGSSQKGSSRADVVYKLAESYRNLTYYSRAEGAYKKVAELAPEKYPLSAYWYAVSLRANGKYQEAQQQLEKFIAGYATNDAYKAQAKRELENCKFIQQQLAAKEGSTTINKLDSGVNKEGASYAASWLNDNTIAFTSTRGTYTNRLYTTAVAGAQGATELAVPGVDKKQQGVASFSADGSKVFFTAWETTKEGKKVSAIYTSEKANGVWKQPVLLGSAVNETGFNARQPYVTADGKYLFFASDKPGGAGKFDIWYVALDSKGITGKATNAGKVINTAEDEEAPFYHQSSGTLVFASNGKTGMGGFDLYSSKGTPAASWEAAGNLGYPINSVKDDIYLVSKQDKALLEEAMVSSDRSSACCLELFAVNKAVPAPPVAKVEQPVVETPPVVVEAPKPEVVVENNKALLQHVLFALNSAELDAVGHGQLKAVAAYLQKHPEVKVEIGAHTDATGTTEHNMQLSQDRAESCVQFLVKEGIDKSRLIAKGYGACCPLEKETTEDGKDIPEAREKNRRVEMKLL